MKAILNRIQQLYTRVERCLPQHLLRFALAGGTATALQFLLLVLLIEWVHCPKVAASASAYLLAALANYLLNYHLTFQSQLKHGFTLFRFAVVVALGVTINTSVFSAALPFAPYIVAQVLATLAAFVSNFLLHKHFTYRSRVAQ